MVMRTNTKILIKKIHALSPERLAEVNDFVEFLRLKQQPFLLTNSAAKISEPVFTKIWDNSDDEVYDAIY
jgi:hypothetical protein